VRHSAEGVTLLRRLAEARIAEQPGLLDVREEDAEDAETWNDIRRTRAMAEGRVAEVRGEPTPELDGLPPEEAMHRIDEQVRRIGPKVEAAVERAARRRRREEGGSA